MKVYDEEFIYNVILDLEDFQNKNAMYTWCIQTFGKCVGNKDLVWMTTNELNYEFRFKNESDRNWFLLRWS